MRRQRAASRLPPERRGNDAAIRQPHLLLVQPRARQEVQSLRQLRQVQDHVGDMQLRHQGHLLVPARGGALAVPHPQRGQRPPQGAHL